MNLFERKPIVEKINEVKFSVITINKIGNPVVRLSRKKPKEQIENTRGNKEHTD